MCFTLKLGGSLADNRSLIDKTILGCVLLGLDGLEKSLFSTKNLNSGSRVFSQVDQRTSMGNESGANEFTDHRTEIRCDDLHSVLKIRLEFFAVFREFDDLSAEFKDALLVFFADVSTHGDFSSLLDFLFDVIRKDSAQISCRALVSHTNSACDLGEDQGIGDDLAHFGEVPSVPLAESHHVVVDLSVQVVQQGNGLDNHGVDLFSGESQFITRQTVSKTQSHLREFLFSQASNHVAQLEAQTLEQVLVVWHAFNAELFSDFLSQLLVSN